jgi:hypothetical protein
MARHSETDVRSNPPPCSVFFFLFKGGGRRVGREFSHRSEIFFPVRRVQRSYCFFGEEMCKSPHMWRNFLYEIAIFRQDVRGGRLNKARIIYIFLYFPLWPLAKFGSFLLWIIHPGNCELAPAVVPSPFWVRPHSGQIKPKNVRTIELTDPDLGTWDIWNI